MSKNHFNTCISRNNKLNQFMSFTKYDCVLRDFIDYLTFYTTCDYKPLLSFLHRDNAPALYVNRLSVDIIRNRVWHFLANVNTVYLWKSVAICQLHELKIGSKLVMKVSLYWKWLKLLRDDYDLWVNLRLLFTDYLMIWEDLTVCRIDYTCDCAKYNFNKYNSMRVKKGAKFLDRWQVQTIYFGKRSHDSAYFIRYYDKKADIKDEHLEFMYPEYQYIDEVMRYELSVNSKWLDKNERELKFTNLYDLITLWYDIPLRDTKKENENNKIQGKARHFFSYNSEI